MKSGISIAVIIPAYNVAPYIETAVRSVLNQPYPNIDIVCVNDGSTDGTLQILQRLRGENERMIILDQPNSGVSAARNSGIEYVLDNLSADYIMFLDGDDAWYPNWISPEAVNTLKSGYDTVLFDHCKADHMLQMRGPSMHTYTGIVEGGDFAVNADHQHFAAAAYKCTLLKRMGIRFHVGQKLGEDIQFGLEAKSLSKTCCFEERLIYIYRDRPGSAVNTPIPAVEYYTILFDGWIQSHQFLEARGFVSGCTYGAIKWYMEIFVRTHFREHGSREELIEALQKYAFCLDVDGPEEQKAKIFVDQFDWKYEHKQRMIGTILKIGGLRNQIPFLRAIKDKQRYPIPLEKQQG